MSPDQKPEWFEIAETDNAASPRKVAKTIPMLALAGAVAIISIGTIFTQTQEESPASAVEKVTATTAHVDPVKTSTKASTGVTTVTPAAGSASMEQTNPNPLLNNESDPNLAASEAPVPQVTEDEEPGPVPKVNATIKAPTSIKTPTIGVKPPKGGEHEGNEHEGGDDGEEGEDD